MSNCLNCGTELKQLEGSREKKYCNDICRATYHQNKNKGKEPKYVSYKTFKELKDKYDALASNKAQQKPENKKVDTNTKKEIVPLKSPENNKNDNPYGFGDEKWLVIENYTKYPLKEIPKEPFLAGEYIKKKNASDREIKEAWGKFKNV